MADIDLSTLTPRDQDTNDQIVVMKEGSPDEMGLVPRARFQSAQLITAAPSSDQANWAPSGFGATSAYIKLQPTTNSFISGITAGATDQFLTLFNDSLFLVCVESESGASTAANRFLDTQFTMWILPQQSMTFRYSATVSRWVRVSESQVLYSPGYTGQLILPNLSTSVGVTGIHGINNSPTLSTGSPTATPTNDFLEYSHIQVTNSTASGTASTRSSLIGWMRGATAYRQGFFHAGLVRFTELGATGAVRAGLLATTAAQPALNSNLTNALMIGAQTSDTNLSIYHNDAAGAAASVSLGANFPAPDADAAYEYCFYAPADSSFVRYMVRRLDSRFVAEGSLTSDLPVNTTGLGQRIEVTVGATAVANTAQMAYLYLQGL
jgi:hypothetical protein